MARKARPLEERFAEKVSVQPQGCWPFIGKPGPRGYVRFRVGERAEYAHRVAYKLHHKVELDEDDEIRQTCGNHACCRPHHLRRFRDGKEVDASGQPMVRRSDVTVIEPWRSAAELTDDEVRVIRQRYTPRHEKNNGRALAREFGISYEDVQNIVKFRARAQAGGVDRKPRRGNLDDAAALAALAEYREAKSKNDLYGVIPKLAEKHGTSYDDMRRLVHRRSYRHLDDTEGAPDA